MSEFYFLADSDLILTNVINFSMFLFTWFCSSARSPESELPLHTGRFLRDYHVLSCLGQGAYGQVFKARHLLDGATYAVKKVLFR